nr:ribonuclease H-like domain-containing protein [Tanacetum cinerariifolium]
MFFPLFIVFPYAFDGTRKALMPVTPKLILVVLEEEGLSPNQQAVSAIAKRRNPANSLENFRISLEEIHKATKNISDETQIRNGVIKVIYKGHFSDRIQKSTAAIKIYRPDHPGQFHADRFRAELEIVSMLHHENIAPFIGYCDEICAIVSEYAVNGSLDSQLKDPNKSITWTQRLKISIQVAKGLRYLHSGFGEYQRVIHGDFGSRKILLYANLEAKIWGFYNSFLFPGYRRYYEPLGHVDDYYMDPVYPCETRRIGDEEPLNLVALVRRYYADQTDKLLDPKLRDEIDDRSLYTFKEIAYKCISLSVKDRPSLTKIIKRLEEALYIQNHGAASNNTKRFSNLEDSFIPLKDINMAIGVKGQETRIGDGGFGVVYKGQPSERWQNRTVAIKCLRPEGYQGEYEFRNELNMIFSFNHENIIPFIGYCDEGNENIIVYEYASNGSLDCHINDKNKRRRLTWEHRLKICLGAARGLDYLHSGLGEDNKVIHRDVKSANILLDHNLVAKVCDFGLSKSGLVNHLQTQVYTNAAGTNFYMDPVYHESGVLRKESDVYSFGVVMFELLSGMLAYNRRRLEGDNSHKVLGIAPVAIIDRQLPFEYTITSRSTDVMVELKSMFEKQAGVDSDFAGFVRNNNMHNMGKTIGELHALLIEYEKSLPKKAKTPQHNADGSLNRYKARLVANGSSQLVGIDVDETFSPVVKPKTIRTVLSLAISRHWPVHQLDRFVTYAARVGFHHSRCDTSLFIYRQGADISYLLIHVDDIVLTASSTAFLQRIITSLHAEFFMTDLGPHNYFLGVSVTRDTSGMFLSQQNYATEVLERAGMLTCNPCRTPVDTDSKLSTDGDPVSDPTLYRSLAGALQYLTFTRLDISYAVQQVCLFMHDPRKPHFLALKRILRYVRGTLSYGLQLYSSTTSTLVAYLDADWAGCPTTRRSTSGYCVSLGNNLLSWSSKRQFTTSRSSAEAEYRGVANAVAETCWLCIILSTIVYCDNVSAVYLSSNPVQHQCTKHIEIDIHFVHDLVSTGRIRVLHVPSRYQYADNFTKGLPTALFDEFRSSLSVRSSPAQTAGGC